MKKRNVCILLILILAGVAAPAQPYYGWRLGAGAGGAAYAGDVGYRFNTTKISWPVYSVQLGRSLGPSLDLELNAAWGRFSANDQPTDWRGNLRTDNPDFARGLHFQTRYRNAGLLLQYKFDNGYLLSQYARFGPYLFAGGGITDFAVYGDLQPGGDFETELSTKERGANYATRVFTVPVGAGVRWRISERLSADLRAGAHYAFTDYLDNLKAGGTNDVYVSAGLSLQYHFELGRDKFRAPVAYVGSDWSAPAGPAVSGNRAEPDAAIDRITPDLDVTPAGRSAADLPDAFVRGQERVQPVTTPNPYSSTARAIRGREWDTLQTRDNLSGLDSATGVDPVAVQLRTRPVQTPVYRADTTQADTTRTAAARTAPDEAPDRTQTPGAVRSQSQLAADGPYGPNPYGRANGNTAADANAEEARVARLESQVAELNRQLALLRQERSGTERPGAERINPEPVRRDAALPVTPSVNAVNAPEPVRRDAARPATPPANVVVTPDRERRTVTRPDADQRRDNPGQRQAARQLNAISAQLTALREAQQQSTPDPAAGRKLDSLLAQVAALNARLDTARVAPANRPAVEPDTVTAGDRGPSLPGNVDLGNDPRAGAAADYALPQALQDQLAALHQSVDRLQRELTAAPSATPAPVAPAPKAPALRKSLPYGPLVVYFALNSAEISADDQQRLASLAARAGLDSTAVVQLKGFADATGNAAYNMELSRRRAGSIRDYLVNSLGMAPERVIVNYFGQAMSTRQKANPYDRRVELEVYVE